MYTSCRDYKLNAVDYTLVSGGRPLHTSRAAKIQGRGRAVTFYMSESSAWGNNTNAARVIHDFLGQE